jgi:hypothetical protein
MLIAEFDKQNGWGAWGVKSCAEWLSWRCSIGRVAAREHVRVARRLMELPLVREAFATGELSYSKVRAITRVATPETEDQLVHLGLHASGAQLEKVVRLYRGAVAAVTENAQRVHEKRKLTYYWNDDGSLTMRACLPPDEGALVVAALKAAEAENTSHEDDSAETPRPIDPPSARSADALVSVARAALDDATSARVDGNPCEVSVHVDVKSLAGEHVEERCELGEGPIIAPETARRLSCDGSVVRIVERDGRPLSVSRRKRTISTALRRALRSRDDGCRFPGCTHTRFLHAHHVHHWARGGPTTLENLIQLCSYHHRLVHEGGFCVERVGTWNVRFRGPDGRLIPDAHPRLPRRGTSLEHRTGGDGW